MLYHKLFSTFKIVEAIKDVRWKLNFFEKLKPKPGLHQIGLGIRLGIGIGFGCVQAFAEVGYFSHNKKYAFTYSILTPSIFYSMLWINQKV